jgi:2-iminobutanoate/2-iminopropanoate deaminase
MKDTTIMTTKAISTEHAPKAIGPYSQAIVAGGFAFLSGQVGIDPATGEIVKGGTEAEARRVLENVRAVLAEAGVGFESVVRTTIYLIDLGEFALVNAIYGEYVKSPLPARATVQVSALPKGARVEIDAIAVVPTDARG